MSAMIVDEILQRFPALAPLASQGIVKVPFSVTPGGGLHVPRGLVPMDSRTTKLLGTDVKAPWPVTVLVSETPERGVLVVESVEDAEGNDTISLTSFCLTDRLVIFHYPGIQRTNSGEMLAPSWFSALLLWTAANHPSLSGLAKRHLRAAKEVAEGTTVTREQVVAAVRGRWTDSAELHRKIHGQLPVVADPAQLSDEDITSLAGGIWQVAQDSILAASSTFALLNTRNVSTRRVQPSGRAFIRRGERPPVAYHEIVWRPFGTKAERLSGQAFSDKAVAVHWTRGNFKTYTEDSKLFGQHVGRYWFQRHLRGRDKSHLVHSTYKVELPSEVTA